MFDTMEMLVDGYEAQTYTEVPAFPDKLAVILHQPRGEDTTGVPVAPDVIKMDDQGEGISRLGHSIPWNRWFQHCFEINKENPGANTRLLRWEADIFIKDGVGSDIDITHPVNALSQDFGGNLVAWDIRTATKIRLLSYHYMLDAPESHPKLDPKRDNFYLKPWLYRVCTAINAGGNVSLPAGGVLQFMPRVAYTELWIDIDKVRFLKTRPLKWGVEDVLKRNP